MKRDVSSNGEEQTNSVEKKLKRSGGIATSSCWPERGVRANEKKKSEKSSPVSKE